jgi:hypothetical protein
MRPRQRRQFMPTLRGHCDRPTKASANYKLESTSVSAVTGLLVEHQSHLVQFQVGAYICHRAQTDSGAHLASCPMGAGRSFPEVKRLRSAYHLLQLVQGLRMRGTKPPIFHMV